MKLDNRIWNSKRIPPGRLITENTTIASDCFHKIQKSSNPRDSHCAYKLNLSKAYCRVDWWFLEKTLLKNSGFARWTDLVMTSLHSVRFCLRLNGHTHELFVPSRGLRQGDPLIPYLFLFVGEALSWFFRKQIAEGCITPIKALFGTRGFVGISRDNPLEYWVKSLPSPNLHKTPPTIH
jgi:hypothetical protein